MSTVLLEPPRRVRQQVEVLKQNVYSLTRHISEPTQLDRTLKLENTAAALCFQDLAGLGPLCGIAFDHLQQDLVKAGGHPVIQQSPEIAWRGLVQVTGVEVLDTS